MSKGPMVMRIALAAFGLFEDKGISGTTMKDISTSAGCSVGNLYHYFDSKDAILWYLYNITPKLDVVDALKETMETQC